MPIDIYLETGPKRCWAAALEWPGWARIGTGEDGAVEALDGYRDRYAPVAERAGVGLPAGDFRIVERVAGRPVDTSFGVLGEPAAADRQPLSAAAAGRLASLVRAAWDELDAIYARTPEHLRKGPRGGGRDREKMFAHVLGAEAGYGRKIGVRHKQPDNADRGAIGALRTDLLAVLGAPSAGEPPEPRGWLPRYAARRISWHVLDHAWEMEDKTP